MLLVIEPGRKTLAPELQADLDNLERNDYVSDELASRDICFRLDQLTKPFVLNPDEDVYILAHSAYDDRNGAQQPWIAGRWFDEFAGDLWAKFGAGLNGRTVWFLVCHTGTDVATLAGHLAQAGFRNLTIYMPTGWMYISTGGVPHLLSGQHTMESANKLVAKASNTYILELEKVSRGTGDGWNGCTIDGNGAVAPIDAQETIDAVIYRFDRGEVEVKS
jgi:hypothetical protein